MNYVPVIKQKQNTSKYKLFRKKGLLIDANKMQHIDTNVFGMDKNICRKAKKKLD